MQLTDSSFLEPASGAAKIAGASVQAADGQPPLDDETFAGCMRPLGPFERYPKLAIAVSGGPDSLALTLLASRWARGQGGQVVGLTVDHGLRQGSAEEADQTGRWLEAHGVEHHILTWLGPKPASGLQHHAREARYALLADWCRERGVLHLLTAHHRQDQAETLALRKARQSGDSGLAAMAPIRDLPGLRLLRPLLGTDKERLIATLKAIGQPWLEDPSNRSPHFTRNRLRASRLDTEALAKEAAIFGEKRHHADRALANALARLVMVDPAGFVHLQKTTFSTLPADLAKAMLTGLLITIGGNPYPPRRERLQPLVEAMQSSRPFSGRTLAHCRIIETKGRWLICREATSTASLVLTPGNWQRFDDRFTLRLRDRHQGLDMRLLGEAGLSAARNLLKTRKIRHLPGVVKCTLPSIWQGSKLLAVPHLGPVDAGFYAPTLDLYFRPRTPLANAAFTAHMKLQSSSETVALCCC